MRKHFLPLLLILTLTACGAEQIEPTPQPNPAYAAEDIPDGHYRIENAADLYPYETGVYICGETVSEFEPNEEARVHTLNDQPADGIFVNMDGIYTLLDGAVNLLSHDGALIASYPVPYRRDTDSSPVFAVSGTRILLGYQRDTGETDAVFRFPITEPVCMVIDTVNGETHSIEIPDSTSLAGISRIFPSGEGFLISAWYNYTGLQETGVMVKYDEKAEIIASHQADEYDAATGMLYSLYGWEHDLYITQWSPESEKNSVCLSVDMEQHLAGVADAAGIDTDFEYRADMLFCTGQDYLIWDAETGVLSVYGKPNQTEENTLTVLYSADQITDEARYFAARTDFCIDIVTYDAARFGDALRMKLLAGDTDFDVVYMGEAGAALTPSVLNYNLFLPLENYETLTSNMELYMDGVTDLMTWNGHLYGVPHLVSAFAVEVSEKYAEKGLPAIPDAWTQEDFWNICETAADTLRGNQVIARSNIIWRILLIPIIEEGVADGRIDSDAVLTLMQNLKTYTDAGIMSTKGAGYEVLMDPVNIPADLRFVPNVSEESTLVSPPLYNGRKYGFVGGYVFVNHLTEKPDLAVRYLELITSPDNLRLVTNDKSLMLKDSDGYYTRSWGGRHTEGERNVFNVENYILSEENRRINDAADSVMRGICPSLYAMDEGFTDAVRDIVDRMLTGEITPETAADEIIREAEYRFME